MHAFLQDLRYGVRTLTWTPGFTLVAALTIGLWIGANTAIYSVVHSVLLRPLPYPDAGRLVVPVSVKLERGVNYGSVTYANYLDWRNERVFESVAAIDGTLTSADLSGGDGEPERRPQAATDCSVVIRTTQPQAGFVSAARDIARRIDPDVPPRFRSLEEVISASLGPRTFNLLLVGIFAATALLLALVGIYGVVAYSVTRRTREIGVRMALGADQGSVLRMVLDDALRIAAVGVGLGVAGAIAITRTLESVLFTFVAVILLLVAVSLLASYLPARRAARVDPMVALRCD